VPRLAAALLGLLLGCLSGPLTAQITVIDSTNREVRLDGPAQRIVALAPHIVENVYSAGAGARLVGAVRYSDFPPQATSVARVGDAYAWSLEKIAALQPDLILMWGSGSGHNALHSLERLGIPVFVSEPRTLNDIPASIEAIGALTGTVEASRREGQRIRSALAALAERYRRQRPLRVFYQIWNEPLQTVNGEHLISDVIELCGGRNVFHGVPLLAPRVSLEAVLEARPEAIVASGMDEARPEWLDTWRGYTDLPAVANDALLFVPPDHLQRPTARILLGARSLCEQLAAVQDRLEARETP
jgi:iron complex transport system substrate-binding protein